MGENLCVFRYDDEHNNDDDYDGVVPQHLFVLPVMSPS